MKAHLCLPFKQGFREKVKEGESLINNLTLNEKRYPVIMS